VKLTEEEEPRRRMLEGGWWSWLLVERWKRRGEELVSSDERVWG